MTARFLSGCLAAAMAVLAAPLVFAQHSGDPVVVSGNTNIDVVAKDVNTVAAGTNNKAITNIGAITKSTSGNTNITVDVQNVENIVTGHGHTGCVTIGSNGPCK
jgi:hypothetical protein